jgi:hypothetical protein
VPRRYQRCCCRADPQLLTRLGESSEEKDDDEDDEDERSEPDTDPHFDLLVLGT